MTSPPFSLSPTAMDQQLDTTRRLLRMALHGVPKINGEDAEQNETMAMHALMAAYVAIAKISPQSREQALRVLEEAKKSLSEEADRRTGSGGEPPLKVLIT